MIGTARDVTELKRAEEALRESEQRYRTLLENLPVGVFRSTPEGKLISVNPAMFRLSGYQSEEEILTFHANQFYIDPSQRDDWVKRMIAEGSVNDFEIQTQRKDGTPFFVSVSARAILNDDGECVYIDGIAENITARKQAEEELQKANDELEQRVEKRTEELATVVAELKKEIAERRQVEQALRESERRSRAVLDQTFQFIGLLTPDGILIEANRAALDFVGVERSEVLGKPFWETVWWKHSEQLQEQLQAGVKAAAAGEFIRFEVNHPALDGSLHYVDFSLTPFRDESGKVILLITEGRDFTDRKKAEEAVQKEQHLLRYLLNLQEQERRMAAYEIHDGLAQQLAGAILQFQAFDQLRRQNPSEAHSGFEAGLRLLEESMSEARRLISGLRPPILDESGILSAIDYLIGEHQKPGGPEITFHHDVRFGRLAPPLETAVFRIVQESLTNACRHSQSKTVRIELDQRDGRIHVEIRDWGIGFDHAQIGQGRFGIQGIRERARLFGGRVEVDTGAGKGTRIAVELPLVENVPAEPANGLLKPDDA